MRSTVAFLSFVLLAALSVRAEIQTDWAYHAADGESWTERVPGETFAFLENGSGQIADGETVTLYVLSANDFAGELDEQVFVRWWDGAISHWIMGTWVRSVRLDASQPDRGFRGLPASGSVLLDLWKIEIPPAITQPGDNFYAIQLKGQGPDVSEERYLLRRFGGDFSRTNNLGQICSASEEFDGQDWMINIWQ